MKRWLGFGVSVIVISLVGAGCGVFRETPPTVTPIYITATSVHLVVPIVATETPSPTSVLAATSAVMLPTAGTPTLTPSALPPITMTPTFTPTATDTPVPPGAVNYAPVGGFGAAGVVTCATAPQGIFATIIQNDANLQAALGCPLSGVASVVSSAYQPLQNGLLIWVSALGTQPQPAIYALYNNGTYQRFNDSWREGDTVSSGAIPPDGLLEPVRGFGKVWRESPGLRDALGWAMTGEVGGSATIQLFERGEMIAMTQTGQTYILITGTPGTWTARAGT